MIRHLNNFILDVLSVSAGMGSVLGGSRLHVCNISKILSKALLTVISYLLPNSGMSKLFHKVFIANSQEVIELSAEDRDQLIK